MEETIAGTSDVNPPATAAGQIPQQRGDSLLDTAVRYAEERHWDVFPGTWLEIGDGVQRCSCGSPQCPAPGAHPARPDWATQATGSATVARRLWSKQPNASILLPTGRTFDAIDVPETAGFLALARMERMELTLGPVTCTPDRRMQFFVLPGATAKIPDLVRKLGWPPASLDLLTLGEGQYVAAPPTRFGSRGAAQWACRPTAANRWLPDAEELISPLAYACGREGKRG
ncbi:MULTISPECIES: bifunctional DNA primase/polymerase [unclassified Streptomyces]|uniref:bifunctional DNA primase/polymerase n=1 Tax=unclassified Streptomyces TaxID=2593676 RepID=UPI0022542278|nr:MULTISPECIES: bifunctional DNA primase/polymerase [unclassified Streptomyces]MCX4828562.1 bifunctional DNA primase/polymerase [Streptomyces sp. NBC_01016]